MWLARRVKAVLIVFPLIALAEVFGATVDLTAAVRNRPIDVGAFGWAQSIAFWVGVVVFIRWQSAAYRSMDPHGRRFASSWAIQAWFIPILNFWRPKQIVDDIVGGPNGLTNAWWTLFLLAYPVASVTTRFIDGFRPFLLTWAAFELAAATAALLVVVIVRRSS